MRKKFKANQYLTQLEQSYVELDQMAKELEVAKIQKKKSVGNKAKTAEIAQLIDILQVRMNVLKMKIDLNFKRLKFCVPELKAIELSDPDGNSPMAGFSQMLKEALSK